MRAIDQLNSSLSGVYAIEHEIGRRGMAIIYLARDPKDERAVSTKVLDAELGAGSEQQGDRALSAHEVEVGGLKRRRRCQS